MSTIKLAVDPEFRGLLPELPKEEREALERSILTEGCRDPIVVWGSIIVDGHNRYDICSARGLPFETTPFYGGPDFDHLSPMSAKREAVKRWIINNQLARRNLTDEQREEYLGYLYESAKKEVGNPDAANIKNRLNEVKNQLYQNDIIDNSAKNAVSVPESTAARIAREHGVSPMTVIRAGKFHEAMDKIGKVSPEVKAKILSGESKAIVSRGQIRSLAGASEEAVKEAVKAVIDNKPLEKPASAVPPKQISLAAVSTRISSSAGDLRSCPPATTEAAGGGDHYIVGGFELLSSRAGDIRDGVVKIINNECDDMTDDELYSYYIDLLTVRDRIIMGRIRSVQRGLVERGRLRETCYDADAELHAMRIAESPAVEVPPIERPDAVNWYADDFLSGIADMTNEQAGAYAKLLNIEQSKGPLTKEQMLAITQDKFVHKKFQITDDGTYINPRMEKEVRIKLAHQAAQRDRINKRWNKNGNSNGDGDQKEYPGNTAVIPVLKDLKDKTKHDKQKDVYHAPLSQNNNGVNVLSLGVKDKTAGVTESAGAGGGGDEFDQTAGAAEDIDQTAGLEDADEAAAMATAPKATKEARKQRGPHGWVKLTDSEYSRLIDEFGDCEVRKRIGYIDESAATTGNKNKWKDWNLVIRKAIREKWGERPYAQTQGKPITSGRTLYEFDRESIESGKYKNILPKT